MELTQTRNLSPAVKTLSIFACAIMTGLMWRVRGSHGFGSMWGMFAVGVALVLFIFAFYGNRRKMSYEAIPAAVILLGITNGGWGTLNHQIGGYLDSGMDMHSFAWQVEISPFSGVAIMLLLGFGWMPLFAVFIGSLFSKKEYKIRHYVILIAVYYVVMLALQASLSHFILKLINPQAVEYFAKSLEIQGIADSPMMAYIKQFGDAGWAKKIAFGRNYFTSIEVISSAISSLVISLVALVAFRDKVTALISTAMNVICALSITVADVFLILDPQNRRWLTHIGAPKFLTLNGWSLWEFFTGFLLGLGIALLLACLPKKITDGEGRFEYEPAIADNRLRAAYNAVLTFVFTFAVTLGRPLSMRIGSLLLEKGIIGDEDLITIIGTVAIGVIAFIPCAIIVKKNTVSRGLAIPVKMRTEDFCLRALPLYILAIGGIYFLTGDSLTENLITFPYGALKNPSEILGLLRNGQWVVLSLVVTAFILFYAFWFAASKKAVKKK